MTTALTTAFRRAFALLLLVPSIAFTQDPHFSQFFASPLTLNPAFTGKFDGDIRASGNYRNQWPTIDRAYQTASLSVDMPIFRKAIPYNDTWGLGFSGYTDKSAAGAVAFNYFSASTAYHKGLDEDGYQQIGLGFQATYANMLINTSQLTFEDQLTPFGFTGVSSELFTGNTLRTNYFDLNAGLLYTASTTDKNNFYFGVSGYHLNRPKQSFTGANYALEQRLTVHGGGYIPLGYSSTLHFSALTSFQGGANETLIGAAIQLAPPAEENPSNVGVYAGAWYRLKDAVIPYVGLEYSDFRLGISYDVNVSDLRTGSEGRGGVEVSLIYIHKRPEARGLPCPKF